MTINFALNLPYNFSPKRINLDLIDKIKYLYSQLQIFHFHFWFGVMFWLIHYKKQIKVICLAPVLSSAASDLPTFLLFLLTFIFSYISKLPSMIIFLLPTEHSWLFPLVQHSWRLFFSIFIQNNIFICLYFLKAMFT